MKVLADSSFATTLQRCDFHEPPKDVIFSVSTQHVLPSSCFSTIFYLFTGSLHTDHRQPAQINLLYCLAVCIQACTATHSCSYVWAVVAGSLSPGSTSLALKVDLWRYKQSLEDLHVANAWKDLSLKFTFSKLISCHLPNTLPEITVLFQNYVSVLNMSFSSESSAVLALWDRSQQLLIHGFVRFQAHLPGPITQFIKTLCYTA